MRHASQPLLCLLLACACFGCAGPHADVLAADTSFAPASVAAPERGAELYGRYCTGCHAAAVRASLGSGGAPGLMHIQARVAMGTMLSLPADPLTREDARQIVDYLDAGSAARVAD